MAAFLFLGGAISDVGARCFIRIGMASSVKAAYDSLSAAADFDALLCCVLWAIPQLKNDGQWLQYAQHVTQYME